MVTFKEILGPIRSTKPERRAALSREQYRQRLKSIAMKKFGPDKSLLHQFRTGKISKSQLRSLPIKKYSGIVSDNISAFNPDKSLLHQFRTGKISKSQLRSLPIKKYSGIVSDNISAFNPDKNFIKNV